MENTRFIFTLMLFSISAVLFAQHPFDLPKGCEVVPIPMSASDIEDYAQAMENPGRYANDSIIIPVVVHNVHWNKRGYMADTTIVDFIRRTNLALANEGEFNDPEGIDSRVRLCLAAKDPQGNPTSGIRHFEHPLAVSRTEFFDRELLWDTQSYLNFFLTDGPRGTAQFPWRTTGFQGIITSTKYTHLDIGISIMVHEVGHHLGLFHPSDATSFGVTSCKNDDCLTQNDMVCDTRPEGVTYNFCFPTNSCVTDVQPNDPNSPFTEEGDDTMHNFMDSGTCFTRFTPGQVTRMHWAANTYLPNYIQVGRDLCSSCIPTKVDFNFEADFGLVGQELKVENTTPGDNLEYTWYLNGEMLSNDREINPIFEEEGFYRVELEVNNDSCGIWSLEKTIQIRCNADPIQVQIPDLLMLDSCYQIEIEGVENLSWHYEEQDGIGSPISLCIPEKGMHSLYLNYQQGECVWQDTMPLFSYDKSDLLRRDYQHSMMEFDGEKLLQESHHIERRGHDDYLFAGANIESLLDNGRNGIFNQYHSLIRKWHPSFNHITEWEIYEQDSLVQFELDTLCISAHIRIKEIYEDVDGSIYIISGLNGKWFEATKEGFYISKINGLGKLEWNKWIKTKSVHEESFTSDNFYIQKKGTNILFYIDDYFVTVSEDGKIIEGKGLVRTPLERFPDGMNQWRYRAFNEEITFQFSLVWDPIVSEPDTMFGQESIVVENKLALVLLGQDLEVVGSKLFSDKYDVDFGSLSISATDDGAVLYFISSELPTGQAQDEYYRHYFVKVNNAGEVLWDRAYVDKSFESDFTSIEPTYLHVLDNGEINGISNYVFGGYTGLLRLDKDGRLIQSRYYNNTIFIEDKQEVATRLNTASKVGILDEDGFMFVANHRGGSIRPQELIFQQIPLSEEYATCSILDTMNIEEIDFTFEETEEQMNLHVIPIKIEVEDAPLLIKKSVLSSTVLCGSTFEIEDYSLAVNDTTCVSDGLSLDLEVCRQRFENTDTISLTFFDESPFETSASIFQNTEVAFNQNEKCKNIAISLPKGIAYHVLLNAKAEYNRPYTVGPSFFDGAEKLEVDYFNNFVVLDACPLGVNTNDFSASKNQLQIHPNPVKDNLVVSVDTESIEQLTVYNMLGQQVFIQKVNNVREYQLSTKKIDSGAYIIQALLSDGQIVSKRFVKGN